MARLWSCGFELNTITDGKEVGTNDGSISTTIIRSGTYAYRTTKTASFGGPTQILSSSDNTTNSFFVRAYLYIASMPTADEGILVVQSSGGNVVYITLTTTGTLKLFSQTDVQIGSSSGALNTNTWYRVEIGYDPVTPNAFGVLNGTAFASGNPGTRKAWSKIRWGAIIGSTTMDLYWDDLAINDSTGSFQNSYPGEGSIVHMRPIAAGESTAWTADSGSNFARVNEVTPDDGTSYVGSNTLNQEDLYLLASTIISSPVSVMQVGVRFANNTADATTAFKVELEKANGGTKSQSSAIVPNSTTYRTNATAAPFNYPLTLYQDPDGVNWNTLTLDTMRVGVLLSTGGTNSIRVSTVWVLVEYNLLKYPLTLNNYQFVTAGNGISTTEKIR